MDLSRVTLAIRPRRPWEAVDLGVRMARHWYGPLLRVWLALTLPLWLVLHLLPGDYLWAVSALLWWTKPLWERAQLHILSQIVFGNLPTTRETLRAFPRLIKPQLIASLTWRRLSPYRSMDLPVTQLEGLNGQRRSDRLALLHQQDAGPAPWLTIVGVHLESFLGLSAVALIWALIPSTVEFDLNRDLLDNTSVWLVVVQNFLAYLAMALVAPFYVACGFALYLNRRVRLEGWDIEIAFRRMLQSREADEQRSARLEPSPQATSTSPRAVVAAFLPLFIAAVFAGLSIGIAPPALASESTADDQAGQHQRLTPEAAKQSIETVLADEDFHEIKVLTLPKFEFNNAFDFSLPKYSVPWIASLLEALMWGVVLLVLVIILLRYRRWLQEFGLRGKASPAAQRPETLFGLDLRPESLPADVPAAVRKLWRQGEGRAALALLYRACLIELMEADLAIRPGYTEEDCLQLVTRSGNAEVQDRAVQTYFTRVTRCWQRLAYSHTPPSSEEVDALCSQWHGVWQSEPQTVHSHG